MLEELLRPENFDPHQIIAAVSAVGAISLRMLREDFRLTLLHEAESYSYTPEPEFVGSGERIVRQQIATCKDFALGSNYLLLRGAFQLLCDEYFEKAALDPFATRLCFNAMALQKYQPGSVGITPHKDGLRYRNLVCVFIIEGQGRFAVCTDRSGREARVLDASPGNIILLRAPGFLSSSERPFHYVSDIQETRYTFGLRQQGP
jgi:hypothetical protein